jgi:hypothetical protein
MIMKTASRRRGLATTPSTQLEVRKWKETTPSQRRRRVLEVDGDVARLVAEARAVAFEALPRARRVLDVDCAARFSVFE